MPNCDFYAIGSDIDEVLNFIFTLDEVAVFETYSPYDKTLLQFHSSDDIADRYPNIGKCRGNAPSVLLALCPSSHLDDKRVRRIQLDPSKTGGASFREEIEGWGLIQLQIGGEGPKGVVHSNTNHNSEARAKKWERTYPEMGPVAGWDFKLVSTLSRRINRHIRNKLAVGKIGARPVLRDAKSRIESGAPAV